jgi:transcriptional regulator with XRE-family HTH domain
MVKRYHTELARRLGRNLAHARRQAGLTQEQLAEQIKVEIATVSRYETGTTLPSLVTLEALAAALHVTMADLLDEEPPQGSVAGQHVLALMETLPSARQRFVADMVASLVGFFRE